MIYLDNMVRRIIGRILGLVRKLPEWYKYIFFQKCIFFQKEKYWPSINKPKRIKEIMFLNRINASGIWSDYIDKHKVKNIIDKINREKDIGLKYAKLIKVVNSPKQIDFDSISCPCFIKGTHGCGMNIFYEPDKTDRDYIMSEAAKWINVDYYKVFGEMNYVGVEKKIILEESLFSMQEKNIHDVKVHCFKGSPEIIQILRNVNGILERKTYNNQWIEKNWFKNECLDIDINNIPKDDIIDYAKILSKNFDYVRIDFFLVGKKLYFAEFTFTPAGGNIPLINISVDEELYNIYKQVEDK